MNVTSTLVPRSELTVQNCASDERHVSPSPSGILNNLVFTPISRAEMNVRAYS